MGVSSETASTHSPTSVDGSSSLERSTVYYGGEQQCLCMKVIYELADKQQIEDYFTVLKSIKTMISAFERNYTE